MSFIEDFKKPFNFFSLLVSVISVVLAVCLFYASKESKEPYFYVHPSQQIFNTKNANSKIQILDNFGKKIEKDIYVAEISFWNEGEKSIEKSEVRTPIVINFPEESEILDYSIVNELKPNITTFQLSKGDGNAQLKVEWLHLDPKLGVRFQVIYTGNEKLAINFSGDIVNAEIKDASNFIDKAANPEVLKALLPVIVLFICIYFSAFFLQRYEKTHGRQYKFRSVKGYLELIIFVIIFYVISSYLSVTPPV